MKILIAADMEGISGVVNWDHVDPNHAEYGRFRRIMTEEVNAAARGAFEGGASSVIVADGHSGGYNILIEEMDMRVRLHSGNAAPFAMVNGIDEEVKGVIFIGYHARAGTHQAILDHTWTSRVLYLWLNDILVGETGLNSALCGHFGARPIMLSGDQAVCNEASELFPGIETVAVKQASSRKSAICLPTSLTREIIKGTALRAVQRLKAGDVPEPFKLATPITMRIAFEESDMADGAARTPGAKRIDGRTIEIVAADMPEAYRAFRTATAMSRA